MKTNSKEQLQKLKEKWEKKLARSGFNDIEQKDGQLKQWHSYYFISRYSRTNFVAKETYYRLANQFLHENIFKSKFEYAVWQLHSSGVSIRDIVVKLNAKRKVKVQRTTVFRAIKKLAEEMKLKYELLARK